MSTPAPADVACSRSGCGHDYLDHERGGACQAGALDRECWCQGFLWVDPVSDRPTYSPRQAGQAR